MPTIYFRKAAADVTYADAKEGLRLLHALGYERRDESVLANVGSYKKGDTKVAVRSDTTPPVVGETRQSSVHVDVLNASDADLERITQLLASRGFERFDLSRPHLNEAGGVHGASRWLKR